MRGMIKHIDWYIIKKFLGAYFLTMLLIIGVAIVIDITEKMDDFYNERLGIKTIILDYYVHFVPYYANLFSSVFTFISAIFVTSKMAGNTEIIAMLAGGINYKRILVPYLFSACLIFALSFYIGSEIIPKGNAKRIAFESQYIEHTKVESNQHNIQIKISPEATIYLERYSRKSNSGTRFSMDNFEGKHLVSRTTAQSIHYQEDGTWLLRNYQTRTFDGIRQEVSVGDTIVLPLAMEPSDFIDIENYQEQLTTGELKRYIDHETQRGRGGLNAYKLEYQKRFGMPFMAIILTLIGVTLSSKKVRGGMGINLLIGVALSVIYIILMIVAPSFTIQAGINPAFAVWVPNAIFLCIGLYLYRIAPK